MLGVYTDQDGCAEKYRVGIALKGETNKDLDWFFTDFVKANKVMYTLAKQYNISVPEYYIGSLWHDKKGGHSNVFKDYFRP